MNGMILSFPKNIKNLALRRYLTRRGLFIRLPIPIKYKTLESEITLGRAVIDRALLDSLDEEESREWFSLDNPDFNTICFIANLTPSRVMKRYESVYAKLTADVMVEDLLDDKS